MHTAHDHTQAMPERTTPTLANRVPWSRVHEHAPERLDHRDVETPWLAWQPSHVQVPIHEVEHASSLAELKRLGQTVYALSWTSQHRSTFWAL
jgi:hypothetical protein